MISPVFSKAVAATGCLTAGMLATVFAGVTLPVGAAVVAGAAFLGLGATGAVAAVAKRPNVSLLEELRINGKRELALVAIAGGAWGAAIGGCTSFEAGTPTDPRTSSVLDPDTVVEVVEVKAKDKWCNTADGRKEIDLNGYRYTLFCK